MRFKILREVRKASSILASIYWCKLSASWWGEMIWIHRSQTRKNGHIYDSLGNSGHEIVKFKILRDVCKTDIVIMAKTSGEWFWLFSSLGRSHGRLSWGAKWTRRAGGCSRTASLKHKNSPFQSAGIWASMLEGHYGWAGNSWVTQDAKMKYRESGSKYR